MGSFRDRPYHAFLSYSHEDRATAQAIHRWLSEDAGFRIWFDENHLEAGSPVATRLSEQMSQCCSWIVLTSKSSLSSAWVRAERDEALHAATQFPHFGLLNLRIDDSNVEREWPSLARFSWLDAPKGALDANAARNIIDRLDGRAWSGRDHDLRDVFVSRGWRSADLHFADAVCRRLLDRRLRFRLIGDAEDRESFEVARIRGLMEGCFAHVALLPARGNPAAPTPEDYRYFRRELEISAELGVPQCLLADSATVLPAPLDAQVTRLGTQQLVPDASELPEWLERLSEELRAPPLPPHYFLAAEYRDVGRVTRLREFIEATTGIPCAIGRDFEGEGLRASIAESISSAAVVIANLSRSDSQDPDRLAVNVNTCVEAGIAIGASRARVARGETATPIFLLAQAAASETQRTSHLPFMFRDSQIAWYSTDAEMMAHCRRILHPFRRRIMNYEFSREGDAP